MDFLPYPKTGTSLPDWACDDGVRWVAQEKIHGAQLVVAVCGVEVRFGKRKAWLEAGDNFFGWQLLRSELESVATGVYGQLTRGGRDALHLYGELFGGGYPHEGVSPPLPGTSPIQTGVWYSPGVHWCCFDAVVVREDGAWFVDGQELAGAVRAAGGMTPPVLEVAGRDALARLDARFITRVPDLLGLPRLAANWAEGYVIKPLRRCLVASRAQKKVKLEEFSEVRYDESRPWRAGGMTVEDLYEIGAHFLNGARLASAVSKVGRGQPEEIAAEMVLDVMVDLGEVYPVGLQLAADVEAELQRRLLAVARSLV